VVRFTLTAQAGDKLYDFTSKNIGQRMAVVMGGRVREVATIESAIRDSGEIMGNFSPDEVAALSSLLRGSAKKLLAENYGSLADTNAPSSSNHCSVTADR
jgi:preprotein translocase subunit SecD